MKTLTMTALAAVAGLALVSCLPEKTDEGPSSVTETAASTSEAKVVSLKVSGMTWGVACVGKVRSALTSVPGVESANVSMPDKAEVKGSAATADLIAAVKKAGYTAAVR